jgi:hypothetical protein
LIYGIGYVESGIGEHEAVIKKNIEKEEYERYQKGLGAISHYKRMKEIYSLVTRNGNEFLSFSSSLRKGNGKIEGLAERLLINYLTSFGMFIDYGEIYHV